MDSTFLKGIVTYYLISEKGYTSSDVVAISRGRNAQELVEYFGKETFPKSLVEMICG